MLGVLGAAFLVILEMDKPQPDTGLEQRVETIRRFSRMYMQRIGILEERIFGSTFTPAEVRVMNEIALNGETTASALARDLKMDGGYLSRILNGFEKQDLIAKEKSKEDGRQYKIGLTRKGRKLSDSLLEEARKIMTSLVAPLPDEEQIRLVAAMSAIDRIINHTGHFDPERVRLPFTMRPHRLGDIGRVIHAYAVQFAADYGWNHEFEAELAERAGAFLRNNDLRKERCLIAEIDGRLAGAVFLTRVSDEVGEMLLPYVAPEARGMGIGSNLLSGMTAFARDAGYKKLVMRTESVVQFAVPMFKSLGMQLVKETPHRRFGIDSVGQDWELAL